MSLKNKNQIIGYLLAIFMLLALLESKYESLGKGLLIGVLVFVPVFALVQSYSQLHMADFMQMLQKVQ